MAIQSMAPFCYRSAKGIKQNGRSVENEVANDRNRLADFQISISICNRNTFFIAGEIISGLQGFCGFENDSASAVGGISDSSRDLPNLWVFRKARGVAALVNRLRSAT
jgi:hypothetical protein